MTISVTSEFREEFEAERLDWLRRRFLWYSGIIGGLGVLNLLSLVAMTIFFVSPRIEGDGAQVWVAVGVLHLVAVLVAALFLGSFVYVKRHGRGFSRPGLLRLVTTIIIVAGVLNMIEVPFESIVNRALSDDASEAMFNWIAQWIGNMMVIHLMASLFIPWTPREAIRPLVPLLGFAALFSLVYTLWQTELPLWAGILIIALLPLVGVPGTLIAWWRHSRFRSRFSHRMLRKSYGDIKRELVDARRIHESLFPSPIEDGPVRFMYVYEPMRQIGGDFLFARAVALPDVPLPLLNVVVIDVTGHGITAALTVNRLAGEIEREFGEKPAAEPGEILHGLNAYLHHTLARHSVYATALCMRIDPNTDELIWASAGHPSAFLRTGSGRIDRLDSTTLLLGACRADDFYANPQRMPFHVGDSVLVYTDGATETRDAHGKMLRTDGMQKIVASIDPGANGGWCGDVLEAIDHFRHGPPQDDTLIVEVARPVSS